MGFLLPILPCFTCKNNELYITKILEYVDMGGYWIQVKVHVPRSCLCR